MRKCIFIHFSMLFLVYLILLPKSTEHTVERLNDFVWYLYLASKLETFCCTVIVFLFSFLCQKMKDDSDGDKKHQIHHIQNLYAFNLFCQKRFDDSMDVFAKLGTGGAHVLFWRAKYVKLQFINWIVPISVTSSLHSVNDWKMFNFTVKILST